MKAPETTKIPKLLSSVTGDERIDDYFWMAEPTDEVKALIQAENAYTDANLSAELVEALAEELEARDPQETSSVPYPHKGFLYYSRIEKDWEQHKLFRTKADGVSEPQMLFDINELGSANLAAWDIRDGLFYYLVDPDGSRMCELRVRDLNTGEDLALPDDPRLKLVSDLCLVPYTKDTLLTVRDPQTYQSKTVVSLDLDSGFIVQVYDEERLDHTVDFAVASDESATLVQTGNTDTTHTYMYDSQELFPLYVPKKVLVSSMDRHHELGWVRLSNLTNPNFTVDVGHDIENLVTVLAPEDGETLDEVHVMRDYLVVVSSREGLQRVRVRETSVEGSEWRDLNLEGADEAYEVWLGTNHEYNTDVLRYCTATFRAPFQELDLNLRTGEKTLLKSEVMLGHDPEMYETRRVHVTSRDGEKIPVSVVQAKGVEPKAVFLQGYGAYGLNHGQTISLHNVSLLERGFVVAIAHVRGGSEKGRDWYRAGRMLSKRNTFNDFIDVAQHYKGQGLRVYAEGRSAGGLLIGAVLNMAPDLFEAVVAGVPFVDVLTTMSNPDLPLVADEWNEWGNPRVASEYMYMRTYCPYSNIQARSYPPAYVYSHFRDSQVLYHEPLKFVTKLRAHSPNPVYLKMGMDTGHGGSAERSQSYLEDAGRLAFILQQESKYA